MNKFWRSPGTSDEKASVNTEEDISMNAAYKKSLEETNTLAFMKSKAHEAFVLNIPSESVKDMDAKFKYPLGLFLHIASLGMFITFFALGMKDQLTSPYLALYDEDLAGGKASQSFFDSFTQKKCQNISNPISGKFYATRTGLWENERGFSYTNATYYVDVNQWDDNEANTNPWSVVVTSVITMLRTIGERMKTQNLGYNMLVWTTFYTTDTTRGTAQVFGLTGSLKTILNRQKTSASISSAAGVCDEPLDASFNPSTAIATLKFDYESFLSRPKCWKALNRSSIQKFGYQPLLDGPTMSISFDMQTLAVALSVNIGINSLTNFDGITGVRATFLNWSIRTYTSNRFPNMRPITCAVNPKLGDKDPRALCILHTATVFMIPFFNHLNIPYGDANLFSYPFLPFNISTFPGTHTIHSLHQT